MEEWVVFKRFRNQEEAESTLQILQKNYILYECDTFTDRYFSIEMGDTRAKGFFVKLFPKDFEKARKILQEEAQNLITQLPEDYYLYTFSAKELVEIVQKPDEWNEIDYELAKELLAEQGISISEAQEKVILEKREAERIKPIVASWQMILMGFLLLPVLYGVVIGWELATSQKVMRNGQKVYVYDERSRIIGKILVICPIIAIFAYIFYWILILNF